MLVPQPSIRALIALLAALLPSVSAPSGAAPSQTRSTRATVHSSCPIGVNS